MNKLLASKIMLYIVLFISLSNLLGYVALNDTTSVLIFIISGLITSYYTGNMIVILGSSILVSNLLFSLDKGFRLRESMVEGMKNKKTTMTDASKDETIGAKKSKKNKKGKNKPTPSTDSDSDIKEGETYATFFKDMETMIKPENFEKMSNHTKDLVKNQESLQNAMKQLAPMVQNAKNMMGDLKGFEGFGLKGMNIDKMMNSFMGKGDSK